jgi:hypothetical protein
MGGPQSRSGRCGEERNLALPGTEPGPPNTYADAIPLRYPGSYGGVSMIFLNSTLDGRGQLIAPAISRLGNAPR